MSEDGKTPEEKTAEEVAAQTVKEKEAEISRKAIEEYLAERKRTERINRSLSERDRKGK